MEQQREVIISDQVLMEFMKEMREDVNSIKESISDLATAVAVNQVEVKDLKETRITTRVLWGIILSLIAALSSVTTLLFTKL